MLFRQMQVKSLNQSCDGRCNYSVAMFLSSSTMLHHPPVQDQDPHLQDVREYQADRHICWVDAAHTSPLVWGHQDRVLPLKVWGAQRQDVPFLVQHVLHWHACDATRSEVHGRTQVSEKLIWLVTRALEQIPDYLRISVSTFPLPPLE